ncbi:MAG: small multi-drug export protein [Eubacteriales bacterium]
MTLSSLWPYIVSFVISMVPVIELRGAIPIAMALDATPEPQLIPVFIVAVFGAFLPSAFIILGIRKLVHYLEKSEYKIFQRYGAWLRKKGERGSSKINKSDQSATIAALRASKRERDHRKADRIEQQAQNERGRFGVWSFIALLVFVMIPLPGTGVWTGSMAAGMLDLRLKQALPAIFIGNLIAGIIITFLTHGVINIPHIFN